MPTASELRQELEKEWWPKWLPEMKASLETAALSRIGDWLAGENSNHNSVPRWFGQLHMYRLAAYEYSQLTGSPPDPVEQGLVANVAFRRTLFSIGLHLTFPERGQVRMPVEDYGLTLAQIISVGWSDEAELLAKLGLRHAAEGFSPSVQRSGVPSLMLHICRDWLGLDTPIGLKTGMGVWNDLYDNWRVRSWSQFETAFAQAAEMHLAESRQFDETGHMERPEGSEHLSKSFEIQDPNYWLFPVILLAILRLRSWMNLPVEEPRLPLFDISSLGKMPENVKPASEPLFDAAERRFRELFPMTPSLSDVAGQLR